MTTATITTTTLIPLDSLLPPKPLDGSSRKEREADDRARALSRQLASDCDDLKARLWAANAELVESAALYDQVAGE